MRGWDSVTQGGSLRPGPAALAVLLGGLLLSLAPVSQEIEGRYYDLLQRLQSGAGSTEIVLVDTRTIAQGSAGPWESEAFPGLLDALGRAGARLILPVDPPPATAALPDARQLAALADLERRRRGDTDGSSGGSDPWAEIGRRADHEARIAAAAGGLRNLVLATPVFEGSNATGETPSACRKHALPTPEGRSEDDSGARRVRSVIPSPATLCQAALGAGHVEFWSDDDGVVRRLDLLVNASGVLVKSAALTAAYALSFPSGAAPEVAPGSITWDERRIRTSGGPVTLLRYYSLRAPESAFASITAADLLAGRAGEKLAGRIAIVGSLGAASGGGYVTPGGIRQPATMLVATGLSNLLASDYLVRPSWLPWLEATLLVAIGAAALLFGRFLPPWLAAMVATVATAALLGAEAYLFSAGLWLELATPAAFAVFSLAVTLLLQARGEARPAAPAVPSAPPAASPRAAPVAAGDDLDLAFSMLRHQPASDNVKQRLYDIAVEHARQRDLAKAERVLRHLASLDPEYRSAGEKLKKLAGLRVAERAAAPGSRPTEAEPPPSRSPADKDDLSGQTIGRYEIERPIGRGAMAAVYLGRDPKINRRVAIKTIALAEEFGDSDLANARAQFLREAESAGRLNHPNIISIYDAGEEGRFAYLAMEYFPGKPLSYYAQQDRLLPARQVLEIVARAADALHYAHGQHVVHRDVKPANLLYDAGTDTLKITDFGIARLTDSSRTKTGIILGTPSYMSPEQLAGTGVTGQSDLFSLGITLYQLLTGAPPFRADSIPRLMQKIAHERHPPLHAVRDDLPAGIDAVIDRALAKDPADRFANGRSMALALRDCCSSVAPSAAVQPT